MHRRFLVPATVALGLLLGSLRPASAGPLSDSTRVDGWRLANGLEVRVRHIPGMPGVVITTGYRSGHLDDPAGREGLAELLAELHYFSAAGDIPERAREEMESLRPLGWDARSGPRVTVLTEVATLPQFPGVLRQVATRMRGVSVTPSGLSAAADTIRREIGARTFGRPEQALYWRVRALATGVADEALVARATGRALAGIKPAEATALLQSRFVPANACLALAGDFSNMNLRSLIEQEFASIPAGTARPDAPEVQMHGGEHASTWPGLERPLGVLGIVAPPLDDANHPSFYLSGLMIGLRLRQQFGTPAPPLTARFQFSALEEPELLRLYLDVAPAEANPAALGIVFDEVTESLGRDIITVEDMESVKRAWGWLLGGTLPRGVLHQANQAPGMLAPLTSGMATRALWRGDAFWDRYRTSFENTIVKPSVHIKWLSDPAHQARLLLTPRK